MRLRLAAIALIVLPFIFPAPAPAGTTEEILATIEAIDPSVETYRADVEFTVGLHWPVALHKTLRGDTYFKRPSKMEVVFADLPAYARQFRNVYVGLGVPSEWERKFEINGIRTPQGQERLLMIPRKEGRLRTVAVSLDAASHLPAHVLWTYRDGTIDMEQQIASREGHFVIVAQHAEIRLPGVSAWIRSKVDHYRFNVPVDDAIFTKKAEPSQTALAW